MSPSQKGLLSPANISRPCLPPSHLCGLPCCRHSNHCSLLYSTSSVLERQRSHLKFYFKNGVNLVQTPSLIILAKVFCLYPYSNSKYFNPYSFLYILGLSPLQALRVSPLQVSPILSGIIGPCYLSHFPHARTSRVT